MNRTNAFVAPDCDAHRGRRACRMRDQPGIRIGRKWSERCKDHAKYRSAIRPSARTCRRPRKSRFRRRNHVVYLSGLVDSGVEVENAESVARQTEGVSDVVNSIAVGE
jgi:hypothetical protein